MLVIIQIIYEITYSLSITIFVLSKREKYFARSVFLTLSLKRKHELFRKYKNGIVTIDYYNAFENNFTTTLRLVKNNISRGNSQNALITRGTLARL